MARQATPGAALAPGSSDSGLLTAMANGDEQAFQALATRHHRAMLAIATAFAPTRRAAEELVVDAWRALLADLTWSRTGSPMAAIGRAVVEAARHRAASADGSHGGAVVQEPEAEEPAVPAERFRSPHDAFPGHWRRYPTDWRSDGTFAVADTAGVVRGALTELPAAMRVVVSLRDVDGWSAADVCSALDLSPGAERLLLHRARSRVRAALERSVDG